MRRNPATGAAACWPYLLLLMLPMLNACGSDPARDADAARTVLDSQRGMLAALGQPLSAPAGAGAVAPRSAAALIGASPDALLERLGTPQLRRPEGDAEIWLYSGGGCQLDLLLYSTPGGLRVLHAQARAGGIGQRTEAACLRDIAHRTPQS